MNKPASRLTCLGNLRATILAAATCEPARGMGRGKVTFARPILLAGSTSTAKIPARKENTLSEPASRLESTGILQPLEWKLLTSTFPWSRSKDKKLRIKEVYRGFTYFLRYLTIIRRRRTTLTLTWINFRGFSSQGPLSKRCGKYRK